MNNILFNTHDIVLTGVIFFCLFLALANNLSRTYLPASRNLLTVFFVLNACVAFDTLVFWGDAVRYAAFAVTPWLLMLFSFAAFAIGPFLFWFFRSLQSSSTKLSALDYAQLLPAMAALPYLYWACLRYPLEQQQALILNLSIFSDAHAHFFVFLTLKKLLPVIYGLKCVALVYKDPSFMARQPAALRQALQMYSGFVLVWVWSLAVHISGQWIPLGLSDRLGVVGNYLSLALLILVWFERFKYPATGVLTGASFAPQGDFTLDTAADRAADESAKEVDELAVRVQELICQRQPHLNAQLTLERFAALLELPPRQVSHAINRCFKQNFHEYINGFRVEEAKKRLRDTHCADCTIVEIAQQAGFNSKATFNRLFKQHVGVTPSVYRQDCVQLLPSASAHALASQDLHNLS